MTINQKIARLREALKSPQNNSHASSLLASELNRMLIARKKNGGQKDLI